MTFGKIGTTLGKEILAWTRTGGSKSLLATRHVKVNTAELKLTPQLEGDVVQISKQANRWTKNPNEYIPDCNIPSHHMVNGINHNLRAVANLKKV